MIQKATVEFSMWRWTVEFSMWRWMEDATRFSYTFHFTGTEDEILKQLREHKDEAYNEGFEDVLAIITNMVPVA
jgi:aspartyl-tRNA synthetase